MNASLTLGKYSFGVGDRFGRQAKSQLKACILAAERGVDVTPVWNKSNREHEIIGSDPASTRRAAEAAVKELGWKRPFHVDADHIRIGTVDRFLAHSDFYTIDVADSIGQPVSVESISRFTSRHPELIGRMAIKGILQPFETKAAEVEQIAAKYLGAVGNAGEIYRYIARAKAPGTFITEVSMDETDSPQTPLELMVILAAMSDEGIPVQTIAPKFTGRFNKGVDYVGIVAKFEQELNDDVAVIAQAVQSYGLPSDLKLSIHSGSDKFSIYPAIRRVITDFNVGLHIKTAGTTWLEEIIGLAEAGGGGLALAQEIYGEALDHIDQLSAPYATVIDIDRARLPSKETVNKWSEGEFVGALRHDPRNKAFNPSLRQLLHVGYKVAAKMGQRYIDALAEHEHIVSRNVTDNLFERHLKPLFLPA